LTLRDLPNIGPALCRRLAQIGIADEAALATVGAAEAYRLLCAHRGARLPVCYYLYSLHGALTGRDWRELSEDEKCRLQHEAGLAR
jgi:hypothetical protein